MPEFFSAITIYTLTTPTSSTAVHHQHKFRLGIKHDGFHFFPRPTRKSIRSRRFYLTLALSVALKTPLLFTVDAEFSAVKCALREVHG